MQILFAAITLSGVIHIWSDHNNRNIVSIIFKPLTMLLIISILFHTTISFEGYGLYILLGLVFSLLGDIMLLKPWYKFELGLGAFLIGHIFYIIGFTSINGFNDDILPLLPFVAFVIWLYRNIKPNLGRDKIPVIVYMLVILVMVWQGTNVWVASLPQFGIYIALGSFIFCVSDSLLAYGRFKGAIKYGNTLVLSSYYIAQTLIAYSAYLIIVN
ncbi:MAG: lysoplasmalogenase [Candidatus Marinimicrobia bacterium]|jgi:uncharacterized membrane protein YhhN|nr:lysoplasmalogenase [Candidatus Neomarinimicrobiota bacterium]MBT3676296.1 lysoplasmalogenase [Candidatus Neomarinimicrobiota bacterium]MBT4371322.1 lysoplasmalogenase [Candidatus Neomarinimicrobiota bacterium]MBT6416914.1 lysoplasmalogenase [Candidatus Neomarinimicrobiota bacterium]